MISEHQQCVYCRQIVKEWKRYNSHHHSHDCYSAEGALEKDNGELTTEDISPQAALDHQHCLHHQQQEWDSTKTISNLQLGLCEHDFNSTFLNFNSFATSHSWPPALAPRAPGATRFNKNNQQSSCWPSSRWSWCQRVWSFTRGTIINYTGTWCGGENMCHNLKKVFSWGPSTLSATVTSIWPSSLSSRQSRVWPNRQLL